MINGVTMKICVDDYILRTLKEDINDEDVSTNAVMPVNKQGSAQLICKDDGVICGLDVFFRTFRLLDDTARFDCAVQDGDRVQKGQLLGTLYGDIKAILSGERTALNYLQRMSGIATITREYMDELAGYDTVLLDTRKTTPNMRPFEKYAVKVGGATNHRYNLSDGVLLKDNHIGAAGSVTKAIQMAKAYAPFVRPYSNFSTGSMGMDNLLGYFICDADFMKSNRLPGITDENPEPNEWFAQADTLEELADKSLGLVERTLGDVDVDHGEAGLSAGLGDAAAHKTAADDRYLDCVHFGSFRTMCLNCGWF